MAAVRWNSLSFVKINVRSNVNSKAVLHTHTLTHTNGTVGGDEDNTNFQFVFFFRKSGDQRDGRGLTALMNQMKIEMKHRHVTSTLNPDWLSIIVLLSCRLETVGSFTHTDTPAVTHALTHTHTHTGERRGRHNSDFWPKMSRWDPTEIKSN